MRKGEQLPFGQKNCARKNKACVKRLRQSSPQFDSLNEDDDDDDEKINTQKTFSRLLQFPPPHCRVSATSEKNQAEQNLHTLHNSTAIVPNW